MSQLPPIPLDYRGPQPPGPRKSFDVVQFFLGLLLGIGVTLLIFRLEANAHPTRPEPVWIILFFGVPIAKGVVGWACARSRRTRWFGLGLIASVFLGFVLTPCGP